MAGVTQGVEHVGQAVEGQYSSSMGSLSTAGIAGPAPGLGVAQPGTDPHLWKNGPEELF